MSKKKKIKELEGEVEDLKLQIEEWAGALEEFARYEQATAADPSLVVWIANQAKKALGRA